MKFLDANNYFWQGESVQLRPLRIKDAKRKWEEWFDTQARRNLEFQCDLPPVSLKEYIEQLRPVCEFNDTSGVTGFAIDSLDGEFVGWVNFMSGDPRHGNFTFGISIFREFQKRGYAIDGLKVILRYGFLERRMEKCNSECLADNVGSIVLHEKLGFVEEGRRRQLIYMDGKRHDVVLFGMLKGEYTEKYLGG